MVLNSRHLPYLPGRCFYFSLATDYTDFADYAVDCHSRFRGNPLWQTRKMDTRLREYGEYDTTEAELSAKIWVICEICGQKEKNVDFK